MLKKLIISFFLAIFFLATAAVPLAKAQEENQAWYNQSYPEWFTKVFDSNPSEIFGERYTFAQVQWIGYSLIALPLTVGTADIAGASSCIAGVMFNNPPIFSTDCIGGLSKTLDNLEGLIGANTKSSPQYAQSKNTSLWKEVFKERPLSGITYVKNLGRKFHLIPQASAANGFGFAKLSVIANFWKAFRNIAYFIFVLIVIALSFMIMFRLKISPQVVISVQSALPKVFITLILVTFSFAIAGFMIDLIYVIMGLAAVLINTSGLANTSPHDLYLTFNGESVFGIGETGLGMAANFLVYWVLFFFAVLATTFSALLSFSLTSILWALFLLIFWVLLIIILLINWFKIIFTLFKTLALVYLTIILAPLQIAMGALMPGAGFGPWLKSLFAKLLVFPLTGILIWFSNLFIIKAILASVSSTICEHDIVVGVMTRLVNILHYDIPPCPYEAWGPPQILNENTASSFAFILISVSVLMAIPKLASAIESFFAERPFDYGTAIGETIKEPVRYAGVAIESIGASASTPLHAVLKSIGGFIKNIR